MGSRISRDIPAPNCAPARQANCIAAVDVDHLAGDEARSVAREKHLGSAGLLGLSGAGDRMHRAALGQGLRQVGRLGCYAECEFGFDEAWIDGIDPHPLARKIERCRTHHAEDAGLGCAIGDAVVLCDDTITSRRWQ